MSEEPIRSSPPINCAHTALVDPLSLKPHPSNPNKHSKDQIALFVSILKYQGWRRPITVSTRSGFVTKGHGALQAALAAGFSPVPIDQQDYPNQDAELADLVADNQLQRMSQMDMPKLTEIVLQLESASDFNLELTALEDKTIKKLLDAFDQKHPDQMGEETAAPGGVAPGSVIVGPAPEGAVVATEGAKPSRIIELFFTTEGADEFLRIVQFFRKDLGIESDVEALLAILRSAFAAHGDAQCDHGVPLTDECSTCNHDQLSDGETDGARL
jgi:hypothetical protein